MRKTEFANGEYYHIFNRGVDKREVFLDNKDYLRCLETVLFVNNKKTYFGLADYKRKSTDRPPRSAIAADLGGLSALCEQDKKLVSVICYCFNPNHYHFILRQETENGIPLFMGKLGNSYTKYFNKKYDRSGTLFQGKYKSIHINFNEYLLLLSAYINKNHQIHGYPEENWQYSSLLDYTGKRDGKLCEKEIILGQFGNSFSEYEKYLNDNAMYFKEKKEMEKYILE